LDVYSLGASCSDLTGQIRSPSSARRSIQRRVVEPPDVRALRPDVPEASAVSSAMMIDPAERYMSAEQMAEARDRVGSPASHLVLRRIDWYYPVELTNRL
jgi:hypothetical protein